jgi:hypothetical protein
LSDAEKDNAAALEAFAVRRLEALISKLCRAVTSNDVKANTIEQASTVKKVLDLIGAFGPIDYIGKASIGPQLEVISTVHQAKAARLPKLAEAIASIDSVLEAKKTGAVASPLLAMLGMSASTKVIMDHAREVLHARAGEAEIESVVEDVATLLTSVKTRGFSPALDILATAHTKLEAGRKKSKALKIASCKQTLEPQEKLLQELLAITIIAEIESEVKSVHVELAALLQRESGARIMPAEVLAPMMTHRNHILELMFLVCFP